MKKIYERRWTIYTVGLVISSAIERFITIFGIRPIIEMNEIVYHTVSTIILGVLFIFTNILLKKLIDSNFITRRIHGDEYIGGSWVEFVRNVETNTLVYYCDIKIKYKEDKILVTGTNYDPVSAIQKNNFIIESLSMENHHLQYLFRSRDVISNSWQGIGDWIFQDNIGRPPTRFTGNFSEKNVNYRVEGFLIEDKIRLNKLANWSRPNFLQIMNELEQNI